MDPDACLAELLALAASMTLNPLSRQNYDPHDVDQLLQHLDDLDEWLTKGGFPPVRWTL